MNIQVPEQKRWLQQRMEPEANHWPLDRETRLRILRSLIAAEEFEHFLHSRFVGQKRFALEGGETALAILDETAGARRRQQRARNRDRHGASRPAQHAGQRGRQGRQADLLASSKAISIRPARRARAT